MDESAAREEKEAKASYQKRQPRPEYSQSIAYTLAVASKLAYEDVGLIKHELEKDGFDVKRTFLPLAFKVLLFLILYKWGFFLCEQWCIRDMLIFLFSFSFSFLEYMCIYY